MSNNKSDLAFVNVINLDRWCPVSGKENISEWEPLGLCVCLLVACAGKLFLTTGDCNCLVLSLNRKHKCPLHTLIFFVFIWCPFSAL